jgi:hypothetical protein
MYFVQRKHKIYPSFKYSNDKSSKEAKHYSQKEVEAVNDNFLMYSPGST